MRKPKWVIAVEIILSSVFGAIFLCLGVFLLFVGVVSYLSGYGSRPAGLEYVFMLFGVSLIFIGSLTVWELVKILSTIKKKLNINAKTPNENQKN